MNNVNRSISFYVYIFYFIAVLDDLPYIYLVYHLCLHILVLYFFHVTLYIE